MSKLTKSICLKCEHITFHDDDNCTGVTAEFINSKDVYLFSLQQFGGMAHILAFLEADNVQDEQATIELYHELEKKLEHYENTELSMASFTDEQRVDYRLEQLFPDGVGA